MTRRLTLLFCTTFLYHTITAQENPRSVVGTWLNEERDARIELYETGGRINGKLVWGAHLLEANGHSKKDLHNSDPLLRDRDLLNLVILTGFVAERDQWEDGKIYDPKSGKTYSAILKVWKGNLQLRGYTGISLIGRTTVWTRYR